MADKIQITDLVPQETVDELNNLLTLFDTVKKSFAKLTKEMAKEIKVNPKSLEELSLKGAETSKVFAQLNETQNKLSKIQDDYQKVLAKLAEAQKTRTATIVEEAKANDLNAAAVLKAEKAENERLKRMRQTTQDRKNEKLSIEEITKIMSKQVTSIKEAEEANKRLRQQVKLITDAEDKSGEVRKKINSQIDINTAYITRNSDALTKQKINIGNYTESIKKAWTEIRNGNNTFQNLGVIAKGFGGTLRESVLPSIKEVGTGLSTMIKGYVGAQAIITGISNLFGAIKEGFTSAVNFEASTSELAAILGKTKNEIADLIKDARNLGATTKYTATEVSSLQIELAKLGFTTNEIKDSTKYILLFAQATGAQLSDAASLAGASLRMFNADTKETERYVSAMAIATVKSALSFSYLQTAMPIVGPVAKAFNFTIEDTLALLGQLSDAGFDASMAATATRNIFLNLADANGKLAKKLGEPVKTLPELVAGLNKLKEGGIDLAESFELTDKRSVAAFNTFLTSANKIIPLRDQITGVDKELGDMANTMTDNVQGALKNLSSAWESLMITVYDNTGAIKSFVDSLTDFVRGVENLMKTANQLGNERLESAKQAGIQAAKEDENWLKSKESVIIKSAELYKKNGMDETAAFEKAKQDQLYILNSVLETEKKSYKEISDLNIKQNKEAENRSFFKQALGMQKTTAQMAKDIDESFSTLVNQASYISSLEAKIEQITGLQGTKVEDATKKTKELTDKEKRELEKAQQEKLKILQRYEESKLSLMDEGLEKEIASISVSFSKQMAEVKGNSKIEIDTRNNLSDAMEKKIADTKLKYAISAEKATIQAKLDAAEKGTQEETDLRIRMLEIQRDEELRNAEKTGVDVSAILEKYHVLTMNQLEKFADERNKKMSEQYATSSIVQNALLQKELDALVDQYSKGEIKKEKFEKKKLEITEKYGIEQAKLAIELAKLQLDDPNLSPEARIALQNKLAEAEIALEKKVSDAKISEIERAAKKKKDDLERTLDLVAGVGDALDAFSKLGSALFDADMQKLEEQSQKAQDEKAKEIENISNLEKNGAITKEEAEARKRAAEDASARKTKELEAQKAALKTKQAKMDKANSIVQTIINTALGITKTIAELGMPLAIPFVAIASAVGAAQLATIIAQPIPKYKDGTKSSDGHKGGLAIVGDGGKKELVMTNKGMWITPDKPTLVDLPKHAQVFPDLSLSPMFLKSDISRTMKEREMKSPVVNITNNFSVLEAEMRNLRYSNDRMTKYMRKSMLNNEINQIAKGL